jgi:hypothetical protein
MGRILLSMSRQTDYSEAILQTAEAYLAGFEKMGDPVPTVEGLADELQNGSKTLYNWAKDHPEFQDVLDRLKAKQGRLLQAKGLKKETDSGITKLMLSANHGMKERSQQEINVMKDGAAELADAWMESERVES